MLSFGTDALTELSFLATMTYHLHFNAASNIVKKKKKRKKRIKPLRSKKTGTLHGHAVVAENLLH